MKSSLKDRRIATRWPVTVLVKCMVSEKENTFLSEMWAKDVNEKGMRLESVHGIGPKAYRGEDQEELREGDELHFQPGTEIAVQDLFYDDEGTPMLKGKVSWAHQTPKKNAWALGVKFTSKDKHSREVIGTLQEFVDVVKSTKRKPPKAARTR
jgi:hypothetical protein